MKISNIAMLMLAAVGTANAMTQSELQTAINKCAAGGVVEVTSDVVLSTPLNVYGKQLTLQSPVGVTNTISRNAAEHFMDINGACNITLKDIILDGCKADGIVARAMSFYGSNCKVTLEAGATICNVKLTGTTAGGIGVSGTGNKLVMKDGAVLRDFENDYYATVVSVTSGGTFDMQGGLITNNVSFRESAWDYGGTVYIYGGTFNMSGGKIIGNDGGGATGGVVAYTGTMNLSGAAEIINNKGDCGDMRVNPNANSITLNILPDWTGKLTIGTYGYDGTEVPNVYNKGVSADQLANICGTFQPVYIWQPASEGSEKVIWREAPLRVNGEWCTKNELDNLLTGEDDLVEVRADISSWRWALPGKAKKVTLRGYKGQTHTLKRQTADSLSINLTNETTVLRLENIRLTGSDTQRDTGAMINVTKGQLELGAGTILENMIGTDDAIANPRFISMNGAKAKVIMEEGAIMRNCTNHFKNCYGVAVCIGDSFTSSLSAEDQPTFEMRGGSITSCYSGTTSTNPEIGYGGTVYVYTGNFIMTGGAITNNESTSSGGVVNWSGRTYFSDTAHICDNVGTANNFYNHTGDKNNFLRGDFRGKIVVSGGTLQDTYSTTFRAEEGATGVWCLHADGVDLVGASISDNATRHIYWGKVIGAVGDVKFANASDALCILPDAMTVDATTEPITLSGAALNTQKTITLEFDGAALMADAVREVPLFVAAEGESTVVDALRFVLPQDAQNAWRIKRTASGYALARNTALTVTIR